jgi:hypothetical protein
MLTEEISMKKILKIVGILAGTGIVVVAVMFASLPWMDRWGATAAEVAASFTGDELVRSPRLTYTRAISIDAAPGEIYPWIAQLGAERGGWYSYEWFETNILRCELVNAERIHPEWQDLKVGDPVKMCPEASGPPPYEVAILVPDRAVVLGHKANGVWIEVWQFILVPQPDGSTRLVVRSRNAAQGWFWDVIRPGEFIMARGMMQGIKERAEAMEQVGPALVVEPSTPTPEIFSALAPSPTPSDSTLPLTCQVTDLGVYVNQEWGYCFAYPGTFTVDQSRAAEGIITLYGPDLEDSANSARVSLEITVQVVPPESGLTPLVEAYRMSFGDGLPSIGRETGMLGGKSAETLDPVPGLLSSRVTMALHENILFTLRFHPSDLDIARPDLEALTQTVTGSFAFLPLTTQPSSKIQTVNWHEFDRNISLSYDSSLAPWVEARTIPAVPVNAQILYAEAQPTFAQIRFLGFQGGRPYDLPLLPIDNRMAQVRVFPTADFPGFGDDSAEGFLNQLQALNDLLQSGLDPARCTTPHPDELALPFLPWINMKQTFCARPQILEFQNGKGVRYISYYSQGPNPVLDREVFYTFQGLTEDGAFYVSAFFPVQTGVFPTEVPACPRCGEPDYDPFSEWTATLIEQLTALNAQPANDFAPSLNVLDDLIQSISIRK